MTIVEIANKYPAETDVIKYFELKRWGKSGVKCVYCHSKKISDDLNNKRRICRNCGKSFSVTVNTQLHDTRLPLKTWMISFSIICNAKKGISALQLSRDLGVHYETAWNMRNKIRGWMSSNRKDDDMFKTLVTLSMSPNK